MPDISKCPFCGGAAAIAWTWSGPVRRGGEPTADDIDAERVAFFARCRSCACEGPWAKGKGGAARLWNARHTAQAEAAMLAPGGPLHEAVVPERVAVASCMDCPFMLPGDWQSSSGCWLARDLKHTETRTNRHPDCPLNTKPVLVTAGETT